FVFSICIFSECTTCPMEFIIWIEAVFPTMFPVIEKVPWQGLGYSFNSDLPFVFVIPVLMPMTSMLLVSLFGTAQGSLLNNTALIVSPFDKLLAPHVFDVAPITG